jgi:hypothetical protein
MRDQGPTAAALAMGLGHCEGTQEAHFSMELDSDNANQASIGAHAEKPQRARFAQIGNGKVSTRQERFDFFADLNCFDTHSR